MQLTCPSCGVEQPATARFCNTCGSALWSACPGCGVEQAAAAAFCADCGLSLREGVQRGGSGAAHEERRVVTVLFADLAGSTALGDRLDPEDVRELQGELFEFLNAEVERHGGMTEKFVGDAVMAIFGAPQAHEDDPERAVRAALVLRDAFPELAARVRARHGLEIGLRMGVNTGEVVSGREAAARGELVVSGDAVNVAARLQQRALPGEVLVGTRTQAAARRAIAFEGPRPIDAKGKADPLDAWTAVGLLSRPARRGVEGLSSPLVGRDAELGILLAVAARVEHERAPQLVTLFGQAGVGKSRLLAELVDRLGGGARLLKGGCLPYGDGITYWPLAEVAKGHAGILESDTAAVAAGKLREAIEATVPAEQAQSVVEAAAWTIGLSLPGETPTGLGSSDVRARLYDAWTRYIAAMGREQPTVLAIEDIHWASEPLLDLLEHLADRLEATSVLIVCPSRPELLDSRPAWGAGQQNATALNLQPLGPDASRQLVVELLQVDGVDDEAIARILERAEGNPFFVEEILWMLIDRGVLERRNGRWSASPDLVDVPLPDSVHGVIAARIDLLDARPREALRRCAVMGRIFWPAAVDVDEDTVDALARRGLVSEQQTSVVAGMREFSFKHALTRDVAYQTLPRPERRDLHRRVGEWIEHVSPDRATEMAELAAYHFVEAISYGEQDPAVSAHAHQLLVSAGEAAMARAALSSAAALLTRALDFAPDDDARGWTMLALARCRDKTGRYVEALDLIDRAKTVAARIGDARLAGDALGWQARILWLEGQWADAVAASEEAVAALAGLAETPQLARALARRSQIEMLRGLPHAEEHAAEAITVARRVGDAFAESNARVNLSSSRATRGIAPSEDEMLAVIDLAAGCGAYEEGFRAVLNYLWGSTPYQHLDDLELTANNALGKLAGFTPPAYHVQYLKVSFARLIYIPTGRWHNVEETLREPTVPVASSNRIVWLEIVGGMALRRGDLAAADAHLPELRELALGSEEPQRILPMAGVVLPRAALGGDGATLEQVVRVILGLSGRTQWTSYGSASIPRALARAGRRDLLSEFLAELELEEAAIGGTVAIIGSVARGHLAHLDGRTDAAVELLGDAVTRQAARGASYEAACLELDLADALTAGGDARQAQARREHAQAVLGPLGCVNPF